MPHGYRKSRRYLILGFALGVSILVMVGAFTSKSANEFIETENELASRQHVIDQVTELRRMVARAESEERGYLLTGNASYLATIQQLPEHLDAIFEDLNRTTPEFDRNIPIARVVARDRLDVLNRELKISRTEGLEASRQAVSSDVGFTLMNRFRTVINRIESKQRGLMARAHARNLRLRTIMVRYVAGGLSFAIFALIVSLMAVMKDVRRRMMAEEALHRSLDFQGRIFDSANVGFITSDLEGNITMFSRAVETWLGYSASEIIGRDDFPKLVHLPEEIAAARRELAEELGEDLAPDSPVFTLKPSRGMPYTHEWTYIRKDGSRFPVLVSVLALRSVEGEIIGSVGVVTNLEKEKAAREERDLYVRQLEEARSLAEERNRQLELAAIELERSRDLAVTATRTKSEFLANMSHEIRTPMNGVMGMAHLLQHTPLNDRQRGFVQTILRSAENLLTILNDILDLSKMEAGKMTLEHFPFDLRTSLEDLCESQAAVAHAKGIELTCRIAPDVPEFVIGDPNRLQQVIANLLSNAIKFTAEGEVTLIVERLRESGNRVTYRFVVRDTGIGIPVSRQESIFESFTQADGSTTRKYGGTGLGLTICRQLVDLMGGSIGVMSTEGKGSEFWMELTLARQEIAPDQPLIRHDLLGRRVLIVDDNATNRLILRELLTAWNCVVVECATGQEAVAMVNSVEPFEVAVLDMHMPGMDGLATAREIRRLPNGGNLPLVLLSSSGFDADDVEAAQLFGSVLFKPIRSSPLYNALTHVTAGSLPAPDPALTGRIRPDDRLVGVRVLVVEDNMVNQMVATELLTGWGMEATAADNGAAAVSILEHSPFDIVLMDVQMPMMDGIEATTEIRRREAGTDRHVPILAMTANAMSGDRERCLRAGMDGYVAKPLQPKLLWDQLIAFVGNELAADSSDHQENRNQMALFERTRLEETCGGKTTLMLRVLERYLPTSLTSMGEISRTAEAGDAVELAAAAHGLKGSSLTIGSPAIGEICQIIEHSAREGKIETAKVAELKGALTDLHRELDGVIAQLKGAA